MAVGRRIHVGYPLCQQRRQVRRASRLYAGLVAGNVALRLARSSIGAGTNCEGVCRAHARSVGENDVCDHGARSSAVLERPSLQQHGRNQAARSALQRHSAS
jgi:hypothetical protein